MTTDFEPNGNSFSFLREWNDLNDTLYVEWVDDQKPRVNENTISFVFTSDNESDNAKYALSQWQVKNGIIHMYSDKINNCVQCHHVQNAPYKDYKKTIPLQATSKMMFNRNGWYLDGVEIANSSTDINMIQKTPFAYIAIGSYQGTDRSTQHYNEISIIHKKYTAEQMIELTK